MFKDKFAASFREIGRDLLNLEINTIVKPNLTSLKMPALPHALLDIASLYRSTLMEKLDLTSMWQISQDQRSSWQPQFLMPGQRALLPLRRYATAFKPLTASDGLRQEPFAILRLRIILTKLNPLSSTVSAETAIS